LTKRRIDTGTELSGPLPTPAGWFFARQEAMLAASMDRERENQADRLESKLRANGGRMTMRDLRLAGGLVSLRGFISRMFSR
jgi:hypothetical protein